MIRRIVGLALLAALAVAGWELWPRFWASAVHPTEAEARGAFTGEGSDLRPVAIDGKRAMDYLKSLCRIGTRISGQEGMKKQRAFIKSHFEKLGAKVLVQTFEAEQNSRPGQLVSMANLIVRWHPERTRRVILCTHYDTRPMADEEEEWRKRQLPFLSANDGGSGVVLLMELGNHMKDLPTAVGVDFVFFDGEEYIFDKKNDRYFFGSRYFAGRYRKDNPPYKYVAAVLST
jgi:glutaminyl-peptide cyclotransferase